MLLLLLLVTSLQINKCYRFHYTPRQSDANSPQGLSEAWEKRGRVRSGRSGAFTLGFQAVTGDAAYSSYIGSCFISGARWNVKELHCYVS